MTDRLDNVSFDGFPVRVRFGSGTIAETGAEVERLGCRRVVVVSTLGHADAAEALKKRIGGAAVGVFSQAVMHSPVEVTERGLAVVSELQADGLVAIGGGSAIGLGKAIAYRTGLPQLVLPTTYAGSEMTSILGQTEGGQKTTLVDPKVYPKTAIYDVDLTLTLPTRLSATSGLNAVAHAIEALYARDRNPIVSLIAVEAIGAFAGALPAIVRRPQDGEARRLALYGAWLAGMAVGSVGMALHHKICHTLGGAFGLDHAETHAVMLPHTAAFNEAVAADLLAPAAHGLAAAHAGSGLFDLAERIGAPMSLREIGMAEADLDRAAKLATERPYWNPREVSEDAVRQLLQDAWQGRRPGAPTNA